MLFRSMNEIRIQSTRPVNKMFFVYVPATKSTPATQHTGDEIKNGSENVRQSTVANTEPLRASDKVIIVVSSCLTTHKINTRISNIDCSV